MCHTLIFVLNKTNIFYIFWHLFSTLPSTQTIKVIEPIFFQWAGLEQLGYVHAFHPYSYSLKPFLGSLNMFMWKLSLNFLGFYIYIINLACQSVCLFVCLFVWIQKTSKRQNQSGPNFVLDLTWSQGRFTANQFFKYVMIKYFYLKLFNFVKFWKCAKKYYEIRKLKKIYAGL